MKNVLKLENNYSWFLSKDDKAKTLLWKALRFKDRGYYHNVRYRMKLWDGYTDFFKKESGRFLTGLLPEVKLALKHLNVDYEIEDKRGEFEFAVDKINDEFLYNSSASHQIRLRDYQVDFINQAIKNKRGIIPSPTGSGKTNAMIGILKALPENTPTLVLVNKKQLVEQNYDEIKKWNIPRVGRFHGDCKEPDMITCATVQSAHLLEPLLPKIKVLIVDEVHEMMSKVPKSIYSKLKGACVRIGMSATAFKFGGSDKSQKYSLKGWIGPMFISHCYDSGTITTKELQDREILSRAKCSFFEVNSPMIPYDIYLDAVTRGIAENNDFHNMVVKLLKCLDGRSLIIVDRIEHGDRLQDLIPGALWVRGQDTIETRKEIIERLKNESGKLVAIATSGIFNTGINVFVHNLINAAGGQADHQIIQRFGRGLRVASDKKELQYYDFVFTINEYLEKHSRKRIKVLEKEGHEVNVYKTEALDSWAANML
jgi:superfamily II DNA or RNA helicase